MAEERNARKSKVGLVVSDKMNKTVVVKVERKVAHPKYGKISTRSTKYYVHDEDKQCATGDTIEIVETRPLSKTKRWRLVKILVKAK